MRKNLGTKRGERIRGKIEGDARGQTDRQTLSKTENERNVESLETKNRWIEID